MGKRNKGHDLYILLPIVSKTSMYIEKFIKHMGAKH